MSSVAIAAREGATLIFFDRSFFGAGAAWAAFGREYASMSTSASPGFRVSARDREHKPRAARGNATLALARKLGVPAESIAAAV
jgi:hypothetical protein